MSTKVEDKKKSKAILCNLGFLIFYFYLEKYLINHIISHYKQKNKYKWIVRFNNKKYF